MGTTERKCDENREGSVVKQKELEETKETWGWNGTVQQPSGRKNQAKNTRKQRKTGVLKE